MLIGIDWGGTKLECIAMADDGAELIRRRVSTPREDYMACVYAVRDLVLGVESEVGCKGSVGFGIPGVISPATGRVKNANSTWLIGRKLDADMVEALQRPVRIDNDANCLALSEAIDGAAAGASVVFAVILGTGTGSGIAIGGRPHDGLHRIAGEYGHNPLPWPRADEFEGPACYCGRHGCLETWISGTGFSDDYFRATGHRATVQEIVDRMRAGEAEAVRAYADYADRVARGFAVTINILDPDVIVLGGGVSNVDELYRDLPGLLTRYVFSDVCETPIRKSKHGDSSGVRGAAWLWRDELHQGRAVAGAGA